ncbi:hypothetical protein ACTMTI_42735 [Nonomuraea sp. H19]
MTSRFDDSAVQVAKVGAKISVATSVASAALAGLGVAASAVAVGAAGAFVGLVGAIAALGIAAAASADSVKGAFASMASTVGAQLRAAAATFEEPLRQLAGNLQTIFTQMIAPQLAAMFQQLSPLIGQFTTALVRVLVPILPAVRQIIAAIVPMLSQLAGAMGTFATQVAAFLAPITAAFAANSGLLAQFVLGVGSLLQILGPFVAGLVQVGAQFMGPVLSALQMIVQALAGSLLSAIVQVTPAISLLLVSVGQLVAAVAPLLPQLVQLVAVFVTAGADASDSASGVRRFQRAGAGAGPAAAGRRADRRGVRCVPARRGAAGRPAGGPGGADRVGAAACVGSSAAAGRAGRGCPRRCPGALLGPAFQFVTTVVAKMVQSVAELFGWLYDVLIGHSIIPDLVTGIGRWIGGTLVAFFADLPGQLMRAVGDIGAVMSGVSQAVMTGIWSGVVSMYDWLKNALYGFFSSIMPDWVRQALGISSPSKVFAQIGGFTMLGMAQGMQASAGEVMRTARSIAGQLTTAFNPDLSASVRRSRRRTSGPTRSRPTSWRRSWPWPRGSSLATRTRRGWSSTRAARRRCWSPRPAP